MYANVKYIPKKKKIWYSHRDEFGELHMEEYPWKPYLYLKDSKAHDAISIYEEPLVKMEFEDSFARRKFTESCKNTYYNLNVEQQYLIDRFHGQEQSDGFSENPLRVFFFDIETYSPNGFPNPLKADDEIIVITVYDTITQHYNVFVNGHMYYAKDDDVIVHYCHDEMELIKTFIRYWRKNFPDVVSGFYSLGFDIPYICNRINRLYNDLNACARLSPVGSVYHREDVKRRYGAVEKIYDQIWTIDGVTHIDMQAAYYKFAPKKLESYSLNSVCFAEGLGQKLEHDGSLSDWWKTNPTEFIDYNIQDVRLLVQLENKLKYMQVCRQMAYSSLSVLGDALSTEPIVTGLVALEALSKSRIISSFDHSDATVEFEGGYVAEPKVGFNRDIMSIDANSLYPSVIRLLNISNETKVGWYETTSTGDIQVRTVNGKSKVMTPDVFKEFVIKSGVSMAPNGVLYSQKKQGILPTLIERLYGVRKSTKKQMLVLEKQASEMRRKKTNTEAEIEAVEDRANFLNIRQWIAKIQLNSIYGVMGEKHYAMFDLDLSKSVTSMGRETIKHTAEIVNEVVSEKVGKNVDCVIYQDTDSAYLSISEILSKYGEKFLGDDGGVSKFTYEVSEDIANSVDRKIYEWHRDRWNCKNPVVGFKREALAPAGLYIAKKMYANWVVDDEGVICDKITYHGIAVARSSTPNDLKPMIKDIIETMIKTQDRAKVIEKARGYWNDFQNMPMMDKSVSIGINNLGSYMSKAKLNADGTYVPALHTPRQIVCAMKFNDLIKRNHMDNKYELIKEGDRARIIYCRPNRFGVTSFAFKTKVPTEWEKDIVIDDKTMWNKVVWSGIQKMFDVVGWGVVDVTLNESVDLMDLFGE